MLNTGVTTTIARGIVREATSVLILPTESGIVLDAMGRPESRDIASACSATSTERPSIPIMDDSELGTARATTQYSSRGPEGITTNVGDTSACWRSMNRAISWLSTRWT